MLGSMLGSPYSRKLPYRHGVGVYKGLRTLEGLGV